MKREEIERFLKNGINLVKSGRYSNALNDLKKKEKEISILPNLEQIAFYQLFGQCYIGEKVWEKAEEYFRKIAELSTDAKIYGIATESCVDVAMLNFGLSNIEKGIQFGEKALELFAKSKDSLFDEQFRSASPSMWEQIKNNVIYLYQFLNHHYDEALQLLTLILANALHNNYGKNMLKLYEMACENFSRNPYQYKGETAMMNALIEKEKIIHEIKRHGRFSLKDPHTTIKADKGKWIDAAMQLTSERLKIKNKDPKDDKIDLIIKLEDILSITKKNSLMWTNPLNYLHVNTKFNDFYLSVFGKAFRVEEWESAFNELFNKLVTTIKQRKFILTSSGTKTGENPRMENQVLESQGLLNKDTDITHQHTINMLVCPQCGVQLPEGNIFCPNCGIAIQ